MSAADEKRWVNLEKVSLLALDQSVHGCKILTQIVRGLGVRQVRGFTRIDEAREALMSNHFDIIIADPYFDGREDGIDLLRWLRRQERNENRFTPAILVSGHATPSLVRRCRDSGANFFVAKPLIGKLLLDRILWVARDKRPFVEVGEYLGPDRRFKDEAPPDGAARRASDEIIEERGAA